MPSSAYKCFNSGVLLVMSIRYSFSSHRLRRTALPRREHHEDYEENNRPPTTDLSQPDLSFSCFRQSLKTFLKNYFGSGPTKEQCKPPPITAL